MNNLYTFAATEPAQGGSVFTMLGIDMGTLIFQIIAFLILVFVLGKWVYPVFINIIDKRQAAIDEGLKAAHEAQAQASESEAEIARLLKQVILSQPPRKRHHFSCRTLRQKQKISLKRLLIRQRIRSKKRLSQPRKHFITRQSIWLRSRQRKSSAKSSQSKSMRNSYQKR